MRLAALGALVIAAVLAALLHVSAQPASGSEGSDPVNADTPADTPALSQAVTATAAATGTDPPAKPTNLQASAVHDSVTLTWTASTDQTVTHYAILRRNPDTDALGVFHVVESNAGGETSYDDSSVSASSTYIYRVKSVSPTGVSQWSGYVKVDTPAAPDPPLTPSTTSSPPLTPSTTSAPPPTPTTTSAPTPERTPAAEDLRPTGLTVSLVENRVTLGWTAPKEDAESVDGYEILRRRPNEGESTLATLVADTESTATAYSDATANEAGVRYVYRVKALRGDDVSLWSNYDRVDLPSDYEAPQEDEPESTSEDLAPTGLSAALADGGGVTLSWIAPAEDADSVTGYEVLRATGGGEPATLVADTGSTAIFYSDATANQAGETYAYEVKAIRGEDRSQASGQVEVQVPHDGVDLAPSSLTAEKVDGGVDLSWIAPAEDAESITGYEVLRATGEDELTTLVADTASTDTTYTDATATDAGETYAYEVKAIRGEDRSQASGEAQVAPPAAIVVVTCEFDAGGSDLPADTGTACVLEVGGSVRGERGAADDVDWYRVALQAGATYQFDMRGKSTGGWQLVDGAPAFVSVGSLEDPKLLGIHDASGALVPGTDSEVAGTGKDSRIASFSPDADGVYYISASAETAWTGTYELSLAVTAGENAEDLTGLAPGGLEVTMVRNRLNLSWAAPAADAESVTGYEILRAEGEAEPATLVTDTQSTATTYTDDTATEAGVSYTYAVKALRGDDASAESSRASYQLPEDYLASTKEAVSKVFVEGFTVIEESPEPKYEYSPQTLDPNTANLDLNTGNPQFVVQPDQEPFTIWSGQLNLGFNRAFAPPTNGSLVPNTFTYNGVDYTISALGIFEEYNSDIYDYEYELFFEISPPIGDENIAAWKFVSPDDNAEFAFADAIVAYSDNGQEERFDWPNSGLDAWYPRAGTPFPVSITGLPGTDGQEPVVDTTPGIKLSWNTRPRLGFGEFLSIPTKVGFTIHRSQRHEWGNFAGGQQVGEVLKCDIAESGDAQSCLTIGTVGAFVFESWTWTDETAQRGVSYLYTVKPYYEFYSTNGTSIWNGNIVPIIGSVLAAPADRVRIYGRSSNVFAPHVRP